MEEKGVDIKSDAMIKMNAKPKKASARTSVKTIGARIRGAVRAKKTKLHPNQRSKRKKLQFSSFYSHKFKIFKMKINYIKNLNFRSFSVQF